MKEELALKVEEVLKNARKFLHLEDIDVQLEDIDDDLNVQLQFLTYG